MLRTLLALLLVAVTASVGRASEIRETEEFADVVAQAQEYVEEFGARRVLLVVDIDNTLLAMNRALGSDQWFEWQQYLLDYEPDSPDLVAHDFDGLLEAQGLLFTLGRMHPPQEDLPRLVKEIQSLGVKTLVLTSRGDEFRIATERELEANGYNFITTAMPVVDPPAGLYLPYDPEDWEDSGLSAEEAAIFGLETPKLCTYRHGVFMTAGQHKGAMLLSILHDAKREYDAVIFVDDHARHVLRVFDALTRRDIEVTAFHYKREDDEVHAFDYSDKRDVTRSWKKLQATLDEVFDPVAP